MRSFDELHPAVLLVYFAAILVPVMVVMDGAMILAALVTGLIWQTVRNGRFPIGACGFYLLLTLLVIAVNALIYPYGGRILFYLAGHGISWEGMVYGLRTGGMLSAALLWCDLLGQLLTGDGIRVLLGRLPKLALLVTMIFRLIPRYRKRYEDVEAAGRVNGVAKGSERVDFVLNASAVFTWALENASQTAEAMELRGFGNPHRTRLKTPLYRRDVIVLVLIALCMGGYLLAEYIPVLLLGLFPVLYRGKEELRWAIRKRNF